jgi:hypothetical protein
VPFEGVWYLYVSFTYDGGKTWTTVNATPDEPVQRGCIAPGGGASPCRNMLDFNDMTVDKQGRVIVAYTDGCHDACKTDPTYPPKRTRHAALVRQTCGLGLFSAYDEALTDGCFTAATNGFVPVSGPARLLSTTGSGAGMPGTRTGDTSWPPLLILAVIGTLAVIARPARRRGS